MTELIDQNGVLGMMERAMGLADRRLTNHGIHVGMVYRDMLRTEGKLAPRTRKELVAFALLHDIGACCPNNVNNLVKPDAHRQAWEHAIRSYLFLSSYFPGYELTKVVLYHHARISEVTEEREDVLHYARLLHLADRICISHDLRGCTRELLQNRLEARQGIDFLAEDIELFWRTDQLYDTWNRLSDRQTVNQVTADFELEQSDAVAGVTLLANVIAFRSRMTAFHTKEVMELSLELARRLNLNEEMQEKIRLGALLHDLGKIGIPLSILEKPDRLTQGEMEIMRRHVALGEQIMGDCIQEEVRDIALRHHERPNGTGYPYGLMGSDLTVPQRLLAVADVISALKMARSYKHAYPKEKCISILKAMAESGDLDAGIVAMTVTNFDGIVGAAMKRCEPERLLYDRLQAKYRAMVVRFTGEEDLLPEEYRPMTEEDELDSLHSFFCSFFQAYYEKRDPEAVLRCLSPNALCVGLGEAACDRAKFATLIRERMSDSPEPLRYALQEYQPNRCGENSWVCLVCYRLILAGNGMEVDYHVRLTAAVHWEESGWLFDSLHISETHPRQSNRPSLFEKLEIDARRELGEMLGLLVPGGVVSCYAEEGCPLLLANRQFLKLLGYTEYEQYKQAICGYYLESIHPEDRPIYESHLKCVHCSGERCECEYRVRRSDGSYVWVHDVSGCLEGQGGKMIILSTVIDITRQRAERQQLERESEVDFLTGVYNRKGALRMLAHSRQMNGHWMFCIADLDNFKQINDIYGHQRGDEVLTRVGVRLNEQFGNHGLVWRMGGDEFGFFLTGQKESESLRTRILELVEEYGRALMEWCPAARSTISVGGVYGNVPADLTALYEMADRNLYQVKYHEKGQVLLTPWMEPI